MKPRQPRPSQNQESSQHHEEDEREMDDEYEIGESPPDQAPGPGPEDDSVPVNAGPAGAPNVILSTS